jgi:hypothetical protein
LGEHNFGVTVGGIMLLLMYPIQDEYSQEVRVCYFEKYITQFVFLLEEWGDLPDSATIKVDAAFALKTKYKGVYIEHTLDC